MASCRPADNPFASHRIEGLPFRHARTSRTDLCRRLEALGGRAAIVGPEGSGKTTLIEELASIVTGDALLVTVSGVSARPWQPVRARLPKPVTANHVVLIDGADRLGAVGWRRLMWATRRARAVVATLHRPGRLPTLIECETDRDLLRELVEELAPADAPVLAPGLDELFERHEGNIRSCFRELYDVYAGRTTFGL
jgi:hypothetical protein